MNPEASLKTLLDRGFISEAHAILDKQDLVGINFDVQNMICEAYRNLMHSIFLCRSSFFFEKMHVEIPDHLVTKVRLLQTEDRMTNKLTFSIQHDFCEVFDTLRNTQEYTCWISWLHSAEVIEHKSDHCCVLRVEMKGVWPPIFPNYKMYITRRIYHCKDYKCISFENTPVSDLQKISKYQQKKTEDEKLLPWTIENYFFIINKSYNLDTQAEETSVECLITTESPQKMPVFLYKMFWKHHFRQTLQGLAKQTKGISA